MTFHHLILRDSELAMGKTTKAMAGFFAKEIL
jgi:hypothetical protein